MRGRAILLYFSPQFVMFIPHVFVAICILMYFYFTYIHLLLVVFLYLSLLWHLQKLITGVSVSETCPTILELHQPMGQWLINQWMPNSTECWWDILSNHLPKDFCNGSMTEYRMLMRHFPAAFWETIVKRFVHCDQRSMTDQRMLIVGTSCSTFPSATIVKTSKRFHQWLLNEW